jgi:hypothetical protein
MCACVSRKPSATLTCAETILRCWNENKSCHASCRLGAVESTIHRSGIESTKRVTDMFGNISRDTTKIATSRRCAFCAPSLSLVDATDPYINTVLQRRSDLPLYPSTPQTLNLWSCNPWSALLPFSEQNNDLHQPMDPTSRKLDTNTPCLLSRSFSQTFSRIRNMSLRRLRALKRPDAVSQAASRI